MSLTMDDNLVIDDTRETYGFYFSALVPEAELLVSQTNLAAYVGQEGLFDLMLRLLTGIANMISKLFNSFKIVYRAFQGLKRTEWQDYKERYAMTLLRIRKTGYLEVADLNMPLPKGLTTTYVDVTQKILACLQACDMEVRAKSFVKVSETIKARLVEGASTTEAVALLFGQANEVQKINNLFVTYDKCFDKSSANSAKFSKLYRSMDDFNLECTLLSDNERFLHEIHSVYKYLLECDANMQASVVAAKHLQSNAQVSLSKDDLSSLANACLFMAKTFDTFGLAAQDLHRVEHNHVEVCKEITRKLKY